MSQGAAPHPAGEPPGRAPPPILSLASRLTRLAWRLCAPLAKEPSLLISNNRQSNHASFYHLFRRGSGRPGFCVLLLGICSFARCVRLVTLCLRRFSN